MEDHLEKMLNLWKSRYSKVYLGPLKRFFKDFDSDRLVKSMLIAHDIGKLTDYYQKYLLGEIKYLMNYRHEVVSAAIARIMFQGEAWSMYVSAAILLSHEPILLGQVGRSKERYFTLTSAGRILSMASRDSKDYVLLVKDGVNVINGLLKREGFKERLYEKYRVVDCLRALKSVVVRTSLLRDKDVIRAKVSLLIHILTLIDSLAARRRSGDEGGTFVSKRAKIAEIGEILWGN